MFQQMAYVVQPTNACCNVGNFRTWTTITISGSK